MLTLLLNQFGVVQAKDTLKQRAQRVVIGDRWEGQWGGDSSEEESRQNATTAKTADLQVGLAAPV